MFNLGLFELGLFGIIALIILGPEQLISTARTLGKYYGKFRRMSARLQSELVSELELTEVQEALQAEINEIRASEARMKAQMQAMQAKLHQADHARLTDLTLDETTPDVAQPPTQQTPPPNLPMVGRFFLLGDYDKKRRLPPPPFLPNYKADQLLYQGGA